VLNDIEKGPGHAKWSMNLTVVLTISLAPISTNMRLPVAEFFTFFAATGQVSRPCLPGAKLSLDEPQCNDGQSYTVKSGDVCNSIAEHNSAPTYQIMCQNDLINGVCTNLHPDQNICLGRKGEDCKDTYVVKWGDSAESIAREFNIPLGIFEDNNYCYHSSSGKICPRFNVETVVCVAPSPIGKLEKCEKIFPV